MTILTTRNKIFAPRALLIFAFFLLFAKNAFCSDWVLGARQFTYLKQNSLTSSQIGVAEVLPSLMLEQISVGAQRVPTAEELFQRQNVDLKKERTSLFLQLSREVQSRDSLIFTETDDRKRAKKIKEAENKIQDIQNKLDENLLKQKEVQEQLKSLFEQMENPDNELVFFSDERKNPVVKSESVVLYKNNFDSLLKVDAVDSQNPSALEVETACIREGINGLITGKITVYGNYMMVNAEVRTYPGGALLGSATDIGTILDLQEIATNLVQELMPKIANALPVELFFDIIPYTEKENVILTMDSVVYNPCPEKLKIDSGIHTLEFEKEGARKITLSYDFSNAQAFYVSVPLVDKVGGTLNLYLNQAVEGSFYDNGVLSGNTNEDYLTHVKINGNSVIGQFVTLEKHKIIKENKTVGEDGVETTELVEEEGKPYYGFYYIPENLMKEDANLMVKVDVSDLNELINKQRRFMYQGYSCLVISVPLMLICQGQYNSANNAYQSGTIAKEKAVFWNTARYVSYGVAGASAAFFIYGMVKYLNVASKVIPPYAYEIQADQIPHFEKPELESTEESSENEIDTDEKSE